MNTKLIAATLKAVGCQEVVQLNPTTGKHHNTFVVNLNNDEQLAGFASKLPGTVNRVFLKIIRELIRELFELAPSAFCVDVGVSRFIEGQLASDAKMALIELFKRCLDEGLVQPSELVIEESRSITYFMDPVDEKEELEAVELEDALQCSFEDLKLYGENDEPSKPDNHE